MDPGEDIIVDYFTNLFTTSNPQSLNAVTDQRVRAEMNSKLLQPYSAVEEDESTVNEVGAVAESTSNLSIISQFNRC